MKYSGNTMKYYDNLNNIGGFDEDISNVGTGIVGSPLCGDVMKLQLLFDEMDVIIDAKYKVFGCVSAISSMELATRLLKGLSLEEAKTIRNEEIATSLELSDIKRHCSVLAKEAIESAINNYISKKNKEKIKMITISEKAAIKLKELVKENGESCKGICVNISSGGCSGFEYTLSYEMSDSVPLKKEITVDGITVFFAEELEMMVNGLQIDIVENSYGTGFVVFNKNQMASSCENCTCRCS